MSIFTRLPAALQAELIRRCPGQVLRVPKRRKPPEPEILAAVLAEMDSAGRSQWDACLRVAKRVDLHHWTVWQIVTRRRIQARGEHSGPGPTPRHGRR